VITHRIPHEAAILLEHHQHDHRCNIPNLNHSKMPLNTPIYEGDTKHKISVGSIVCSLLHFSILTNWQENLWSSTTRCRTARLTTRATGPRLRLEGSASAPTHPSPTTHPAPRCCFAAWRPRSTTKWYSHKTTHLNKRNLQSLGRSEVERVVERW
jgi:hypothetical protein